MNFEIIREIGKGNFNLHKARNAAFIRQLEMYQKDAVEEFR